MIRVCLIGLGKTGKEIAKALLNQKKMKLVSVVCSSDSDKKGKVLSDVIDCNDSDLVIDSEDDLRQVIFKTKPDVVIDFSNPEATIKNAKLFSKMKVNMVIGTTGFSDFALKKLFVLTQKYHNAICYAPNITLGVNVLMLLTHLASSILNDYDFQITEIHHKNKKDVPSGTAVKIAKEIKKGLDTCKENEVEISAIRAGGVVGKHEVLIIGEEDKIEISHESFSRKAFAPGAVKAIEFIHDKVGYYEMTDVLNLQKVLENYLEKESSQRIKKYNKRKREVDKSPVIVG
ncbi:4-hydroxy-tetrahydrodipicolinate reductase [Herbivorax sp. ANBcel31]|uniref:4-hydroxy-tetrahydrodipicolinate reductase n=1 Tax=Herbivorax sp. ANBcel31 TaxID=3069754 RepID=UPI0027B5ED97|nr:4-hydroxy-tetrahydrodipicolinate reductase [Herbivorax sp. ANBcel31]MDQ2087340.1 4-hydroxy-tetrahydrodipicolinate reductase [Herbivorax sp. ANBcel31]